MEQSNSISTHGIRVLTGIINLALFWNKEQKSNLVKTYEVDVTNHLRTTLYQSEVTVEDNVNHFK